MLVLMRRPGEVVWIGDAISIAVTSVDRNKVRLGFTAPADVPINRQELLAIDAAGKPIPVPCGPLTVRAELGRLQERVRELEAELWLLKGAKSNG